MKGRILKLLALGLLLALALLSWRAARLPSRQLANELRLGLAQASSKTEIDSQAAAQRLAGAVRIQTVSSQSLTPGALAEFESLHAYLAESFPLSWRALELEVFGGASLLLHWRGRGAALDPVLLMAHLDVVPVEPQSEALWKHPPFGGVIADGKVWGRGTLDDKGALCAWLEAVEFLLAQGWTPARSVYFAFGHDEEIGGEAGNAAIAAALAERGVRLSFVLDEGGFITDGLVSLVEGPLALIGIAEKGYLTVTLSATAEGGHSSIPAGPTAIERVARALTRLEERPFPARVDGATRDFLSWLAPETGFLQRTVLANLWLCAPLAAASLSAEARTAAMVRTTCAATVFHAGVSDNVLPTQARAQVNLRLLPGDSIEYVVERLRARIADDLIQLEVASGAREASAVSSTESAAFRLIQHSIACVNPEALVAPYLVVGATDAKHYAGIADEIYRFQPYLLTPTSVGRFHGPNEFVSIEQHAAAIRFCLEILRGL